MVARQKRKAARHLERDGAAKASGSLPRAEDDVDDDSGDEVPLPDADAYGALLISLKQSNDHEPELQPAEGQAERRGIRMDAAAGPVSDVTEADSAGNQEEEEDGEGGDGPLPDGFTEHFAVPLASAKAARPVGLKWGPAEGMEWLAGLWKGEGHWETSGGKGPLPAPPRDLPACHVRERLVTRWRELHGSVQPDELEQPMWKCSQLPVRSGTDFVDAKQRALFSMLASYRDVFLPGRPYPVCPNAADPYMDAVLLHCLNHCIRSANIIKKNNNALKARKAEAVAKGDTGCHIAPDSIPSDQGFTSPKVLLLLPQRNLALRVVSRLVQLAIRETHKDTIKNKQRFIDDFSLEESNDEAEGRRKVEKQGDYKALFTGNLDDHFLLGIRLGRGSLTLYSDFLQSDIIMASPIALLTRMEEDAGTKAGERPQAKDFLSSIEILVVDRADMMLMQNWGHVCTVASGINQLPTEQHGTDIMRVREGALSGEAGLYRQTVVLSSFASPEINALVHRHCRSHAGALRWRPEPRGVLASVVVQVQQLFERLQPKPPAEAASARFEHFKKKVWPSLKEGNASGQLIFVASYFDFVRLRNFLLQESSKQDFVSLCEYTKRSDVSRGRSNFFHRRRRLMLYTERAHFYHRRFIRGVQDILFYSLPSHSNFYYEIVNFLEPQGGGGLVPGTSHGKVSVMYDKYEALTLERTVGAARAAKMLKGSTSTFMFC